MKKFRRILSISLSLLICTVTNSYAKAYFLCGPDEDGCGDGMSSYCFCIPFDESPNSPHCLNLSQLSCQPVSQSPHCQESLIFDNQASCLAVIFQSTPVPPCIETTYVFCEKQKTKICHQDGRLDSCH